MKRHVVASEETGNIVSTSFACTAPEPHEGYVVIESDDATEQTHFVRAGALVAYSTEELAAKQDRAPHSNWSNAAMQWVDVRTQQEVLFDECEAARARRTELLATSDWTQALDSPLCEQMRMAWRNYRQALRDISQQAGFPFSVVWPTAPGA